jgi:hypothetical protein
MASRVAYPLHVFNLSPPSMAPANGIQFLGPVTNHSTQFAVLDFHDVSDRTDLVTIRN